MIVDALRELNDADTPQEPNNADTSQEDVIFHHATDEHE